MELITNIIIEYLKHNKRLCVPKLGTFIVKQSSGAIIFSDLMRNDDGVLRSLLMAYGIRELEANGMIDRLVFEVHHAISAEGKMTIENFGVFTADRNNTITFTQAHRQQKFGGNIKPPVEVLERRKIQQQRQQRLQQRTNAPRTAEVVRPTKRVKSKPKQEDNITLGKPDAYLRGLKYDNSKNKKREESGRSTHRSGSGKWWITLLLCLAVVGGVAALLWFEQKPATPTHSIVAEPTTEPTSPVIEVDSTAVAEPIIDSLSEVQPDIIPSTIVSNTINEQ